MFVGDGFQTVPPISVYQDPGVLSDQSLVLRPSSLDLVDASQGQRSTKVEGRGCHRLWCPVPLPPPLSPLSCRFGAGCGLSCPRERPSLF